MATGAATQDRHDTPDISVCVSTFQRPQRLARLLESLRQLSDKGVFTVELIIVDNDATETARPIIASLQDNYPYPVRYSVEPRQNIAHARNRTVQMARGTWIAFIDDDEVADASWLSAYWQMQTQFPGDGYFGTVFPRLEQAAPAWLDKDIFLALPRYPTGTKMLGKWAYTTNAFIRRSLFETHQFDPNFKFPGGEDLELFIRMADAGAQFYFCDEAVTHEYYPPERVCLGWLLKRHFRGGFMYTRIDKMRRPGFTQQVPNIIKAAGGMCLFALMLPFELLRGWTYAGRRLLRLTLQIGHIWEFCHLASFFKELTFEEYQVRDKRQVL